MRDIWEDYLLFGAILLPALVATTAALWVRRWPVGGARVLACIPAALFVGLLVYAGKSDPQPIPLPWATNLGFGWDLIATPTRILLALLITGIGAVIIIYAGSYFKTADKQGLLLSFLFGFMAAMLGLVFADNLFVLLLCWEATSVLSFFLIGFYNEKDAARRAAIDAILITGAGGLALVAAVLLLGEMGGSYKLSELALDGEVIRADGRYPFLIGAVLIAVMTKSAQIPFHFWLPGAMTAPAPVSAYLHSATMVKAGIFLIMILQPILGGTVGWQVSLQIAGAVSMTIGAVCSIIQFDVKRVLAFSTVSALGTLLMLLGIGNRGAIKAAVIFLLVHAFYKAALFMVAGALEKATGTRDLREMGGLRHDFPWLATGAGFAALSMAGIPPLFGFIGKELIYESMLGNPRLTVLLICAFVANSATVAAALLVGIGPFWGSCNPMPRRVEPIKTGLVFGPLVLGILGLLVGLIPNALLQPLTANVVAEMTQVASGFSLKLWHGFNLVLLLSAATLVCGVIVYRLRRYLWALPVRGPEASHWDLQARFRDLVTGTVAHAQQVTRKIHNGDLNRYVSYLLLTAIFLVCAGWYASGYQFAVPRISAARPLPTLATVFTVLAVITLCFIRNRMTTVLLLGCAGFGIAFLYAILGAPDLAITQLLVETLSLVMIAALLRRLPRMQDVSTKAWKAAIALVVGVGMSILTLKATGISTPDPIGERLAALSVPEGFGRNVVNVILVDFRAFDTLGEVAVLVLGALGILALMGPRITAASHPIPRVMGIAARYLSPLTAAIALFLLIRGHNEPGGGFIAGLVMAISLWLAGHANRPVRDVQSRPVLCALMVCGVLTCVLSGIPGLLQSGAYLDAVWVGKIWLPIAGKVLLGTPLLFDIGVFAAVTGIAMIILIEIGQRVVPSQQVEASH